MAVAVPQIHPRAHVPLVLGVWRRLEVATVIARLRPPHPAPALSGGRGVEALGLAILDGHQALSKVGRRLEERGMVAWLQPGFTRASRNDDRLGHLRDALCAAHLNTVLRTGALNALAVYAIPTPWRPQDTPTIARSGAYEDEPPTLGAPRPASGPSQDGRDDRKPVRLSLGVSGAGGVPRRLGGRDGHRSARVEPPRAIEACRAWGLAGVRGMVADRQASSRRTLGLGLEHTIDVVTLVPRTWAVRQELEAWARPPPAWPRLVETPGRTKDEAPRRGHGPSVRRDGEVEYRDGRVAVEALRLVVVPASPLAQPHTQTSAAAPGQAAEAVAHHVQQVHAPWCACRPEAEAASAASEGPGQGHRGRRPRPWRSHAVR